MQHEYETHLCDDAEDVKEDAISLFKELFDSDEDLLEGSLNTENFPEEDWFNLTGGIHDFPTLYREAMLGKMMAHDRENETMAYRRGALEGLMTHTYLDLEERAEAGMARVNALFAKDEAEISEEREEERNPVDAEETLETLPFTREELESGDLDNISVENVFKVSESIETNIEPGDFGEWEEVYQSFLKEAELTVGTYFEDALEQDDGFEGDSESTAESYAEAAAYFETMSWIMNKVQAELDLDYDDMNDERYFQCAWKIKAKAATQRLDYPERLRDRNGQGQYGSLPNLYLLLVNNHDAQESEIIIENTEGWAETLENQRRDNDDMDTEYPEG